MAAVVLVQGLTLEAEIGVNPDEAGRRQPLEVEVEAQIDGEPWRGLAKTLDYERIVAHAQAVLREGHIGLVETFAHSLAAAILAEPHVTAVRVRALKPQALAGRARAAGVEISLRRD